MQIQTLTNDFLQYFTYETESMQHYGKRQKALCKWLNCGNKSMNDYKAYNTSYLIGLYQMEARATFHVHFTGIYTQTMKFPPRTLI